jgi:hypothetical protein
LYDIENLWKKSCGDYWNLNEKSFLQIMFDDRKVFNRFTSTLFVAGDEGLEVLSLIEL